MEMKYLPIGTVVQLKESEDRVMIAGYYSISALKEDTIWDYSGFRYPTGYMDDDDIFCFNNDQIEFICHLGCCDLEQQMFEEKLNEAEPVIREQYKYEGEGGNN